MDVVQDSSVSTGNSSAKQPALGLGNGFVSGNACNGPMVQPCESTEVSDHESSRRNNPSDCLENDNAKPFLQKQDGAKPTEKGISSSELTSLQESGQVLVSPGESDAVKHVHQNVETTHPGGERVLEDKTPVKSRKRRSSSALPVTNRVLRSRSQEKAKEYELKDEVTEDGATETNKRKRRKKRVKRKMPVDQFSRIITHLRYLLHRIKYEQNLIDAYAGEGWKGQSLEKIKPEKELQRAKSQIFRYKLKIRDLFQRIDMSLAEGKLPETLFDDDGQIDSEDIFCAKCGSKDLTLDNDIILCDGACERGFHQFCLEPPLLKDDVPPDDEGWLCPGCDCKVDCMEMLSDFQGSTFSLLDNWEKVFPEEAAAALSGTKMDDYAKLPSDDSEDDDYDPCIPQQDQIVSEEESSSDGSDYFSADDDIVPTLYDKQILALPSDDSEDDDFDPSAPHHSDHSKEENSSSDFTSDSEGEVIGTILNDDEQNNSPVMGSVGEEVKLGRAKRKSLSDELAYLLKSSDAPKSAKRHVERLDYKKLHQETYGDTSSDSSDEDYGETAGIKRGKRCSVKGNVPWRKNDSVGSAGRDYSQHECEKTPADNSKNHKTGSLNRSAEPGITDDGGSNSKSTGRKYKRLEESVVQRLHQSFKENQYPKLDMKESLAQELGIRVQQVSKWFENARWSSRHSVRLESKMVGTASANGTSSPQNIGKIGQIGQKSIAEDACNSQETTPPSHSNPGMEEGQSSGVAATKSSTSLNSKKKKSDKSDHHNADKLPSTEKTPEPGSHGGTSKSRAVRRSGRLLTKTSSS